MKKKYFLLGKFNKALNYAKNASHYELVRRVQEVEEADDLFDSLDDVLPEGVEMVMPGDNVKIKVELIYPVALNEGLRFAIREGGRTVGSGQVVGILD